MLWNPVSSELGLVLQLLAYDLSTSNVEELPEHLTQGLTQSDISSESTGTVGHPLTHLAGQWSGHTMGDTVAVH